METALRALLKHMLDDYVTGLEKANMSQFPVTLRNLQLKPKAINQELEDIPFNVDEGRIGMISVSPGWMGNVDVEASGISVKLSFDARKAAKLAMRPNEPGSPNYSMGSPDKDLFLTNQPMIPQPPPPPVPPRFCSDHDSSDKRVKTAPHDVKCIKCGITYTTSYADALFCPPCSEKEKRCLICGKGAETASTYIPSATMNPANSQAKDAMKMQPTRSMDLGGMDGSIMQSASAMNTRLPPGMQQSPSMQARSMKLDAMQQAVGGRPAPPPPPGKGYPDIQGQRPPYPAPGPVPVQNQRPPQRPQQRGPPQPEEDPSFMDFLRAMTCSAMGTSDGNQYNAASQRRR